MNALEWIGHNFFSDSKVNISKWGNEKKTLKQSQVDSIYLLLVSVR